MIIKDKKSSKLPGILKVLHSVYQFQIGEIEVINKNTDRKDSTRPKRQAVGWDWKSFTLRVRTFKTSGWRLSVQAGFTGLCLYLGWKFWLFVRAAQMPGDDPLPHRPPGVEGFLPISGLMGALDWIYTGTLNFIHPAATILLLLFIAISLILRKTFCSWICPVGFVSDNLARLGQIIFKRNFRIWKWADYALRTLKHLLLGFFVWAIFSMPPYALKEFIESPYNKISDVKMLLFFVELGLVGAVVISALVVLSLFVQGFWCRYLCPYGALLGLFSWMSPVKVRRDANLCTDCGICDKVCPARLPVSVKPSITSVECIGCADCVVSCPVKGALDFGTVDRKFSMRRIALMIIMLFGLGYIASRFTATWDNRISDTEYRYHIQRMSGDEYTHPGR